MRIERRIPKVNYTITDPIPEASLRLEETNVKRDPGVMISQDIKPRNQVQKAASKTNMVLSIPRNTFVSRDPFLWKKLYATYVRPHLEYAVAAWSPYTKEDKP